MLIIIPLTDNYAFMSAYVLDFRYNNRSNTSSAPGVHVRVHVCMSVSVCLCVLSCHPKWWVGDHAVMEEARESGWFVRSWLIHFLLDFFPASNEIIAYASGIFAH